MFNYSVCEKLKCNQIITICFLLLLLCSFNGASAAQPSQPLQVATIPLPPWGFKDDEQHAQGICYEWANAIAQRMGRNIDNRIVPMSRLFKALEFGKADFSIMLRTPFSEQISVPIAYVGVPFRTIVWPRKGVSIQNYDDLKHYRLSMARGLKVGGEFSKQENLQIVPSMDYAHSMLLFKAGRVDAIVGTEQSLRYNAFKMGLNPQTEFGEPFELARLEGWVQASHAFAAREGTEELEKAAKSLIEDGTFRRIYERYQTAMTSATQ